jgi:hypothetical protein
MGVPSAGKIRLPKSEGPKKIRIPKAEPTHAGMAYNERGGSKKDLSEK